MDMSSSSSKDTTSDDITENEERTKRGHDMIEVSTELASLHLSPSVQKLSKPHKKTTNIITSQIDPLFVPPKSGKEQNTPSGQGLTVASKVKYVKFQKLTMANCTPIRS